MPIVRRNMNITGDKIGSPMQGGSDYPAADLGEVVPPSSHKMDVPPSLPIKVASFIVATYDQEKPDLGLVLEEFDTLFEFVDWMYAITQTRDLRIVKVTRPDVFGTPFIIHLM